MASVVVAKWIARPGEEDAVAAAIAALIPPCESEHFQGHGHGDALPRLEAREREFYETW